MSANFTFDSYPAEQVTDSMLEQASILFSSAYGVWSPAAEQKMGKYCKQGTRIRISAERLKRHYLTPDTNRVLVRCMAGDTLVGHAFATRWIYKERQICWVTQLCVRPEYRRKGLATQILRHLRKGGNDWSFGILSSNPAAVMALLHACNQAIEEVSFDTAKRYGADIMAVSPIKYVRDAQLKGSVFGIEDGTVCCANTNFWVDHAEPLAILAEVKKRITWPFGELPEGCEFLALVSTSDTTLHL